MHILLIFLYTSLVFSHGGEKHSTDKANIVNEVDQSVLATINSEYLIKVKPIFVKTCFDCHSDQVNYPWYYKVPVIKQLIDSDIADAKKHLDFSSDFPFLSHDTPINDLESIRKDILNEEMPPLGYRLMHPNNTLTDEDKSDLLKWLHESLEILKNE